MQTVKFSVVLSKISLYPDPTHSGRRRPPSIWDDKRRNMGFLHKLWDDMLVGPAPGKVLRKYDSFSVFRSPHAVSVLTWLTWVHSRLPLWPDLAPPLPLSSTQVMHPCLRRHRSQGQVQADLGGLRRPQRPRVTKPSSAPNSLRQILATPMIFLPSFSVDLILGMIRG